MGVVTPVDGAVAQPGLRVPVLTRLIPPALRSETAYRRFALWAVITNVIIVGQAFAGPMLDELDAHPGRYDLSSITLMTSSGVMWS